MWLTASLFNQLTDRNLNLFAGLKNLLTGGERLSPPHVNRVRAAYPGLNLINGYGPTENTTFAACHRIERSYYQNIPIGRPVRLMMASQDVIHSFYVPAFRIKRDVVPGRFNEMWFQATQAGEYHLFCAEYCGTQHSGMIGWVEVMEPTDYQKWLAGGSEGSLASQGEKLFQTHACNTCHTNDATARGPVLVGLYGSDVTLGDNSVVKADDNYIRESILNPQAKLVKGFGPIMPTFQGQVSEDDLLKLLAYIKSLSAAPTPQKEQRR